MGDLEIYTAVGGIGEEYPIAVAVQGVVPCALVVEERDSYILINRTNFLSVFGQRFCVPKSRLYYGGAVL
jgi:hypothetical protein